jgi:hypothetical protein
MAFNKVGIYYIHWEQHDMLWPSIMSQVDFVDYIFVLDSSLEKKEIKIPEYCKHKVEVEHTHKFGSGFNDEYGLGVFEQVDARNYAMDKVFEKCEYMIPCDADEFLSPELYFWARTAGPVILNIPELQWRTETGYVISPHRHNRGGHRDTGFRHIYNPNTPWLKAGKFHKSRHIVFTWDQKYKTEQFNKAWHNHLHYLHWPIETGTVVNEITPGNPDFLCNGLFPSAYKSIIEERKINYKFGMRRGH